MKLLMLKGLPACGKSTYAEELVKGGGDWVRVNRDLLRTMLHFDKWRGNNEGNTVRAEVAIVQAMLAADTNVIVDDTNLGQKHRDMWSNVATNAGAKFEVKNFDTPLTECLKRDYLRDKKVGQSVIMNMAMQYNLIPQLDKIVVCDIDGTVANCEHRQHYVRGDVKDWKGFFSEMQNDTPRQDVYDLACGIAQTNQAHIIFVSARPESYRKETEIWLDDNNMAYTHLLMRPANDKRPDTEVKQNIYNKFLKHYDIVKVFDDRPSVIKMWRDNGLDVEDVGNGIDF